MTFTELEYVLMLCCVVLLWRISVVTTQRNEQRDRADRYCHFLLGVHRKQGRVVEKGDSFYYEPFEKGERV